MPDTSKTFADPVASATQALLDSGLDAILRAVLRPMVVMSPDGRVLGMNPTALKLVGFAEGEEVGKMVTESPWFIEAPERAVGLMTAVSHAANGEPTRWSMSTPTEDHPSHRVSLCLSPVRDRENRITAVLMERNPLELAPAGAPPASPDRELRLIVEAGRLVPGVWDVDLDSLWLHPLVHEVFHVPESYGGKKLETYLELIHPEDRPEVRAQIERTLAEGREFKAEFRVPQADGTETWWAVHGGVQRRADGRAIRIAGLAIDITQRKEAGRALRESEQRFRTIFEHSTAGIVLADIDGRFVNANPAYCQMLGYTEQQLQQKRTPDVIHPEHSPLVQRNIERLRAGDLSPINSDRPLLRADGQTVWVRVTGGPLHRDGQILGHVVVTQDITFQKHAMEAIKESETRFRVMADSSPAFLWISDPEGQATFLNKAASTFMGVEAVEVGNLSDFIHPEDSGWAMSLVGRASAERRDFSCEYRVRRNDGVYRWMIVQGIPRFSSEGEFLGHAGSAVDITDRLMAERALRSELEHRKEMEQELHVLSERLIQAQEQTRHSIARELHDDLGQRVAALGYALFNLKRKLPEITTEAEESIHRLEESIAKLGSDIRDLSHRLHPATLDHGGLTTALKALANEFGAAGLNVTAWLQVPDHSLPAEVEVSLFRVAQEALQNVARHAGVSEAEVHLVSAGGRMHVRISDRGVGFDPEADFHKGFGLISMRERARLLHGSLTIESSAGQGTTIFLEIPLG